MGFLDSSSGRSTLASGFGGQLFAGRLATGGFTCSLLGTSHFERLKFQMSLLVKSARYMLGNYGRCGAKGIHWLGIG